MSVIATSPCCSAKAGAIRDETGHTTSYRALQREDLIKMIGQVKRAIYKPYPNKEGIIEY